MLPGRWHWTETVTVLTHTPGGPDPANPMGSPLPESWDPDPNRTNVEAFIESMDRERVLRAGLETTIEHWFIRVDPSPWKYDAYTPGVWFVPEGELGPTEAVSLPTSLPLVKSPRVTQQANRIRWHNAHEGDIDLTIVDVNAIPGEEIELTVTRAPNS